MTVRERLQSGLVIPAHPLALSRERKLDEKHQHALTRYYLAAGAGGVAVGVHTTQFAIRDPKIGLFKPVLELAMDEMRKHSVVKIAGICGKTPQAVAEAEIAKSLGYEVGLLSLADSRKECDSALLDHTRQIASTIPVMGFYLQPAVGGRVLGYEFWRQFAEIENVVAIKIAPFNRYQTIDVLRAVADSGRADEIALYTGNDDHILLDLLCEYDFGRGRMRIVGGLLGHWAVWTQCAVSQLVSVKGASADVCGELLNLAQQITDANAALFDPANEFRGCIAGVNEVLRRQGLLQGRWCLDPHEDLSPGQSQEIDRVCKTYPHLQDNAFVQEHLDEWLR
jgi:dihydrodipicolinate synthase/N-acetylneuraminate lyase